MQQAPFKVFSVTTPSPLPHFTGTKEEVYTWLSENTYGPDGFEVYETETETTKPAREFLDENDPFAPKYYRMNPETDDILFNGSQLANGMRVLIEDSKKRIDMNEELTEWQKDRALENNRWCTVGAMEVNPVSTRFIGVYDDGSKRMRVFDTAHAWFVKKDSIRRTSDRFNSVCALVHESLREAKGDELTEGVFDETPELDRIAEETTKHILKTLGLL